MSSGSCCGTALQISNKWYAPEEFVRYKAKDLYEKHSIATRAIAWLPMSVIGAVKPFLFPVWALVGFIALPIIAAYKKFNPDSTFLTHTPKDYMKAWAFSAGAVAGFTTFLALSAFVFPLVVTGGVLATSLVVSIVIHTYRSFKDPTEF